MCPHCGSEAPIVYRGALAFCSACNRPRVPLSAAGVNLAGKPAKIGGTVASIAGWLVLAVMLAIAIILGAVLQAIFPVGAIVGWAVGAVIAAMGVAAALVLLLGGRFLSRTGDKAAMDVRREAVFALARNEKGILRAPGAARALGVPVVEAEAFLTGLSRDPDSAVTLEVDADGKLYYRFTEIAPDVWPPLGAPLGPTPAPPPPATAPSPVAEPVRPPHAGVRVEATAASPRPRVATQPMPGLTDAPVADELDEAGETDEAGGAGTKRARGA